MHRTPAHGYFWKWRHAQRLAAGTNDPVATAHYAKIARKYFSAMTVWQVSPVTEASA